MINYGKIAQIKFSLLQTGTKKKHNTAANDFDPWACANACVACEPVLNTARVQRKSSDSGIIDESNKDYFRIQWATSH